MSKLLALLKSKKFWTLVTAIVAALSAFSSRRASRLALFSAVAFTMTLWSISSKFVHVIFKLSPNVNVKKGFRRTFKFIRSRNPSRLYLRSGTLPNL